MAKFNIENVLNKFKDSDGNVDYTKVNDELETQNNNIITKQLGLEKESMKESVVNEYINTLGFDGVNNTDSLKAHIKRYGANASELTEQNAKLSSEIDNYKTQINDLSQYKEKVNVLEKENLVTDKGFNPKYKRAVLTEAQTLVSDDLDFASALDQVKENYNEWLNEPKKASAGGATPKGNPPKTSDEQMDEWRKRYLRR